jgi:hypothetical protein
MKKHYDYKSTNMIPFEIIEKNILETTLVEGGNERIGKSLNA